MVAYGIGDHQVGSQLVRNSKMLNHHCTIRQDPGFVERLPADFDPEQFPVHEAGTEVSEYRVILSAPYLCCADNIVVVQCCKMLQEIFPVPRTKCTSLLIQEIAQCRSGK